MRLKRLPDGIRSIGWPTSSGVIVYINSSLPPEERAIAIRMTLRELRPRRRRLLLPLLPIPPAGARDLVRVARNVAAAGAAATAAVALPAALTAPARDYDGTAMAPPAYHRHAAPLPSAQVADRVVRRAVIRIPPAGSGASPPVTTPAPSAAPSSSPTSSPSPSPAPTHRARHGRHCLLYASVAGIRVCVRWNG